MCSASHCAGAFKIGSVKVDAGFYAELLAAEDPNVTVDIVERTIRIGEGKRTRFPLDPFAAHCLATGVDELGYLLSHEARIAEFEKKRKH